MLCVVSGHHFIQMQFFVSETVLCLAPLLLVCCINGMRKATTAWVHGLSVKSLISVQHATQIAPTSSTVLVLTSTLKTPMDDLMEEDCVRQDTGDTLLDP